MKKSPTQFTAKFINGVMEIEIVPDKPGFKRARKKALKHIKFLDEHPRNNKNANPMFSLSERPAVFKQLASDEDLTRSYSMFKTKQIEVIEWNCAGFKRFKN